MDTPNGEVVLGRDQMLTELLADCNSFIDRSSSWRKSSFETAWRRYQRAADSIYDPDLSAKKEPWQSRAFVPLTPSHRENAQAAMFKNEVGPRPPLEIKARKGIVNNQIPGDDQSENIQDLILREREKSRYETERNKVLEDKTTYGSGFARVRFETRVEERLVKVPDFEPLNVFDPTSLMRAVSGQKRIIGYHDELQSVVTYRGMRFEHISIWDIFPDPRSLKIPGSQVAHRYSITYGEIVKGAEEGYYLPESVIKLRDHKSEEDTPEDKKTVEADRAISDSQMVRTKYAVNLTCYERYVRLPKKWVFINGEDIDDPEKLIPARVQFHKDAVIAVEVNPAYDGEPPIYKDDYMPVAGQFYGRGIPEMLKDAQAISNEEVSQRLDAKAITLNPRFAVIEKSVVDPRDFTGGAGSVIRFKAKDGITNLDQLFKQIDMGSLDRSAFIEPQEWERWAQERTSVNRQTLGTAGQVKDSNQTLGGMELIKAATGEKFAYLGMLSEFDFQYEVYRAFWKLIYQNYTPEDVALALGDERAATFVPMPPEQVENSYQYFPTGTFTMENKALRQARLAQIDQQFGMMPYFNRLEVLKAELHSLDEEPSKFIIPEAEAVQIIGKAQEMAQGMAKQAIDTEVAREREQKAPAKQEAPSA